MWNMFVSRPVLVHGANLVAERQVPELRGALPEAEAARDGFQRPGDARDGPVALARRPVDDVEEAVGRRGSGDAAAGQRGVARAPRVLGVADVLRRLLDEAADADRGPVGDGEPRCAPRGRDGVEELAGPGSGPPRLEERVGWRFRAAPLAGEGAQQEHVARGVAHVREPVGR